MHSDGVSAFSATRIGASTSAVFSNWCRREVRIWFVRSAALCVSMSKNRSSTSTQLASSPSSPVSRA